MTEDLYVLLLPSLFAAGLVLILLGLRRPAEPPPDKEPRRRLEEWMSQAGLQGVRPGHLIAFCGGLGLVVGLILLGVSRSIFIGLAFAALAGYLPVMLLRARRRRRVKELQEVWPDAIDNLASAVRAGLSLPEALASLAERGPEPLRPPFARFAETYHATGHFNVALDRLKDDLSDATADRVIEALRIAREVGGSELGRTLRTLSAFLRDAYRVRKELEARQSWVVVAARLAFATPWFVLLLMSTRPEMVRAYQTPLGGLVLAVGAALAGMGYKLMLAIGRIPPEERVLR